MLVDRTVLKRERSLSSTRQGKALFCVSSLVAIQLPVGDLVLERTGIVRKPKV